MAVVFAAIAAGVFVPAAARPVLAAGVIVALVIWVAGENFGQILTGGGTDPNTGPLLILLAATFWPWSQARLGSRQRQAASSRTSARRQYRIKGD